MAKSEPTARTRHEHAEPPPIPTADPVSEAPVTLEGGGLKLRIHWRMIVCILGVIVGGGSVAGITTTLGTSTASSDELGVFRTEQVDAHRVIDRALVEAGELAAAQDTKIEQVSRDIQSVQTIQQRDISRTEARRLTEKIGSRREREEQFDRLYELNLKRLGRNADPCGTLSCD